MSEIFYVKFIVTFLTKQHSSGSSEKNMARIAKRCPEIITSVVKYVKLLFPKKFKKLKKKLEFACFFVWRSCMIFLTTVTTVFFFFIDLISQYFWKKQFDLFDNQCNVLRAAFCDSRGVFLLDKVVKLVSGECVINGAYPV